MLERLVAISAVLAFVSAPALAQQQTQQQRDQQAERTQDAEDRPLSQVGLVEEDTIQGANVRNSQGEKIGDVEHLVLDMKKGQVAYAIIGVGGFLGVGEKSVAVPWDKLQPAQEKRTLTLNADRQTLQNAPTFDSDKLAQLETQSARREISAFWDRASSQQAQTPSQRKNPPNQ